MKDKTITIKIEPEIRVINKVYKKKSYKCCSGKCPFMKSWLECGLFKAFPLDYARLSDWYCLRCDECIKAEEENERDKG